MFAGLRSRTGPTSVLQWIEFVEGLANFRRLFSKSCLYRNAHIYAYIPARIRLMLAERTDVVTALDRNEVTPYFQPIVELRTGQLKGFEVLARWQHPEHGPVLPSNFISLAEAHGLIDALTQQVFRKAFHAALLLPEPLTLSVNVSPVQLNSSSLPFQIRELAEEAGFP